MQTIVFIPQFNHYDDVIMGATASQITSLTIVYLTVYSDPDKRKHQSSTSLASVRGIHRWPVNSPHKLPVRRKMFPFYDVIVMSMFATFIPHQFQYNVDIQAHVCADAYSSTEGLMAWSDHDWLMSQYMTSMFDALLHETSCITITVNRYRYTTLLFSVATIVLFPYCLYGGHNE